MMTIFWAIVGFFRMIWEMVQDIAEIGRGTPRFGMNKKSFQEEWEEWKREGKLIEEHQEKWYAQLRKK